MSHRAELRRLAASLMSYAQDQGFLSQIEEGLRAWAGLLAASSELRAALSCQTIPLAKRLEVARDLGVQRGLDTRMLPIIGKLSHGGRLGFLDELLRMLPALVDRRLGRARACVRSARPLGSAQRCRLRDALERHFGENVVLDEQVEPELIGGIVVSVKDLCFDASVRNRLEALRRHLMAGIHGGSSHLASGE